MCFQKAILQNKPPPHFFFFFPTFQFPFQFPFHWKFTVILVYLFIFLLSVLIILLYKRMLKSSLPDPPDQILLLSYLFIFFFFWPPKVDGRGCFILVVRGCSQNFSTPTFVYFFYQQKHPVYVHEWYQWKWTLKNNDNNKFFVDNNDYKNKHFFVTHFVCLIF